MPRPRLRYCSPGYGNRRGKSERWNPCAGPKVNIQARLEEEGARVGGELPLTTPSGVLEFAHAILPRDDSSLQWSGVGSGRTADPAEALERLFDRMVTRYDERPAVPARDDEDVWRHFKRTLEARRVLQHFKPKKIAAARIAGEVESHARH